jgi:2-C-methyl-D-erythritol 2,4-cyclodiphosphate synthase
MPELFRIGHGYDIHRLHHRGELVLGGVVVADGISPVAHSDGDVVIHALVDAILGAIGAGDIGEHFPDSDPAYKNAASVVFLQGAMKLARDAGYHVVNADLTILAEQPRLKPFKAKMAAFLADAMSDPSAPTRPTVNIKAGTNEGCGEIGRGEAIAAHAVVLLAADG